MEIRVKKGGWQMKGSLIIVGFFIFTLIPVVFSFILAFMSWDSFSTPKFVGLANFTKMVQSLSEANKAEMIEEFNEGHKAVYAMIEMHTNRG